MASSHSTRLVLFGVTGDLAHKMDPSGALCDGKARSPQGPDNRRRSPNWNMARLHKRVMDSIERSGGIDDQRAFRHFLSLLKYVNGDYKDPNTFAAIKSALAALDARRTTSLSRLRSSKL